MIFKAEDFYSLNEDVVAAAIAASEKGQDGEPSNDLAAYSLPDSEVLGSGVLPPPPPPKLILPNNAPALAARVGRRKGAKRNNRYSLSTVKSPNIIIHIQIPNIDI